MKHIAAITAVSIALMATPSVALADSLVAASGKTKWPECFCTDRYGKRRELGEIICLTVGGRSYEAKCVMAQNNPFWRDLQRGCLSSRVVPKATPFPTELAFAKF